jgi:hypothetical protein
VILIDDLLFAPITGLVALARELQRAALEEQKQLAAATRQELADLYRALETGAVTEEEFDRREGPLLDRLDALEAEGEGGDEAEEAEEAEEVEE